MSFTTTSKIRHTPAIKPVKIERVKTVEQIRNTAKYHSYRTRLKKYFEKRVANKQGIYLVPNFEGYCSIRRWLAYKMKNYVWTSVKIIKEDFTTQRIQEKLIGVDLKWIGKNTKIISRSGVCKIKASNTKQLSGIVIQRFLDFFKENDAVGLSLKKIVKRRIISIGLNRELLSELLGFYDSGHLSRWWNGKHDLYENWYERLLKITRLHPSGIPYELIPSKYKEALEITTDEMFEHYLPETPEALIPPATIIEKELEE